MRNGEVGLVLQELLEILKKTNQRKTLIDVNKILELLIAHYFSGKNYENDGMEWSREESRIMAYTLLNTLQITEMILGRKREDFDEPYITGR